MVSQNFEVVASRWLQQVATAAMGVAILAATPAQASFGAGSGQVAAFTTVHGGLEWINSGPGNSGTGGTMFTTLIPGSGVFGHAGVDFSFMPGSGISGVTNIPVWFQITGTAASGNPATYTGGSTIHQKNINNGFYTFTAIAPGTSSVGGYGAGTVLLYGKFSKARIIGTNGGSSMIFYDSSGFGPISMFSSLPIVFPGPYWFKIKKAPLSTPLSALPGRALKSFDPDFSGSFGAGAVPEPASWTMMIAGFGMAGAAVRRRERRQADA